MCSQWLPALHTQASGSAWLGVSPSPRSQSEKFLCHIFPLKCSPCNAFVTATMWPSRSRPSSLPAMMKCFSAVQASRCALPASAAHSSRSLSSARKATSLRPHKGAAPEQVLSTGASARRGDSPCLESAIVLDIMCKATGDLLVPTWRRVFVVDTSALERVIACQLASPKARELSPMPACHSPAPTKRLSSPLTT